MRNRLKHIILLAWVFTWTFNHSIAQNVMIDEFGNSPDNSALLEVDDSLSGFFPRYHGILIPRLTEAQRNAIIQPANGLLIYQLDVDSGFHYNRGTALAPDWQRIADVTEIVNPNIEATLIQGNNANGQDFFGLDSLGVDNASPPSSQLHINESAGSTSVLLITDLASGTAVSDGFRLAMIAGNSELRNFENGPITFSNNALERMRLTNIGLGIGTSLPTRKLDVQGYTIIDRLNINSSFNIPSLDGTPTQLITTNGAGVLSWSDRGDDLGLHIATRNLRLNGNFISNDGDAEGLIFADNGRVGVGLANLEKNFTVYDPSFPALRVTSSNTAGTNNIINAGVIELGENNPANFETAGIGFRMRYVGNGSNTDRLELTSMSNGTVVQSMVLKRTNANVGVGIEQAITRLQLIHPNADTNGLSISNDADNDRWHIHAQDANDLLLYFNNNLRGAFNSATGAYLALSDKRTKYHIRKVDEVLPMLLELEVKGYRYLGEDENAPLSYGFLAQELQSKFPSLVMNNEEEVKTVNYNGVNAIAVAGAKEQYAELEALEKRIERLERKLKDKAE